MNKCLDCGHIFEDGEQAVWSEGRGECWGRPAFEEMDGCPLCRGDYEKAKICECCEEIFCESELTNGICDECFEEKRHDIDLWFEHGEEEPQNIELNAFLIHFFGKSRIEAILFKALKEYHDTFTADCLPYMNEDKEAMTDWLCRKIKKEKGEKK